MDGRADQLVLVSARHIMSMLCEDWRFRSSGALSVIAEEPRPVMLLYQILKGVGLFCGEVITKMGVFGCMGEGLGLLSFAFLCGCQGPVSRRKNWVCWWVPGW